MVGRRRTLHSRDLRIVVVKSHAASWSVRPILDVGAFAKSGDHATAGRDRELRAHSRYCGHLMNNAKDCCVYDFK